MLLEIPENSQENTCARVSFLIKLLKKRLWCRCFPVNFAEFLRTPISQNTSVRLFLNILSKGFGEMKKICKMGISECSLNAAQSTFLTFHTLIIEKEIFSFCLMKLSRSNRLEMFKKGILKTFSKFIGKLLCRSVISYFDLGVIL